MPRRSGGTTLAGVETVAVPTRISPASGAMNPAISRSSVVLPQPDGPSSVTNARTPISSERSRTAVTAPNVFVTRSITMPAISGSSRERQRRIDAGDVIMEIEDGPDGGRDIVASHALEEATGRVRLA